MTSLNRLAIQAICLYQGSLSRVFRRKGVRCLHYPSCSEYGSLAFAKYGFAKAALLTWKRYRDCHPFSGRPYIDFPPGNDLVSPRPEPGKPAEGHLRGGPQQRAAIR